MAHTFSDACFELVLNRLPEGGYLITDWPQPNMMGRHLFACTTIDEALSFLRMKLGPPVVVPADYDPLPGSVTKIG